MVENEEVVATNSDTAPNRVVVEPSRTVVAEPATRVVEEPSTTYVRRRDPYASTMAASAMIQTLIWSAVVIVLLVVGILVLVHYGII